MILPWKREKAEWVKVLEVMYEEQMAERRDDIDSLEDLADILNTPTILMNETDLTPEEMTEATNYLEHLKFIEENAPPFSLTQEGLQLAHQIKTERQRHHTNIILVALTLVLVVLTLFLIGIEFVDVATLSL